MPDPLQDPIFVLHRYFITSNEMMLAFRKVLSEVPSGTTSWWESDQSIHIQMYMSLWYGTLWAVAEGWTELNLADSTVDALLAVETGRMRQERRDGVEQEVPETYADMLRRVRNAVFHYQRDYFDQRVVEFMRQQNSAAWVQALQAAFGKWFLTWLRTREESPG